MPRILNSSFFLEACSSSVFAVRLLLDLKNLGRKVRLTQMEKACERQDHDQSGG
jgi:hypothetical protein